MHLHLSPILRVGKDLDSDAAMILVIITTLIAFAGEADLDSDMAMILVIITTLIAFAGDGTAAVSPVHFLHLVFAHSDIIANIRQEHVSLVPATIVCVDFSFNCPS